MARVLAICNAKGGVGKTTTAVNLSAYLAALGRRTLLIDFDPQANASSALGSEISKVEKSIYHGILGEATPEEIVRPTMIFNFHYVPSATHLVGALVELVILPERELFLRKFLHKVRHEYDYILIDLSPSLSMLTINGLAAADEVLIPVQAEYYGLEGLGQLLHTVGLMNKNLKHPLKIAGALITMYEEQGSLSREVAKNVRSHFPYYVFKVQIPRSIPLAEAPSFGKPVMLYRPDSAGAQAYRKLAEEVIAQEQKLMAPHSHASARYGDFNV